jgi:hypothetical protein
LNVSDFIGGIEAMSFERGLNACKKDLVIIGHRF